MGGNHSGLEGCRGEVVEFPQPLVAVAEDEEVGEVLPKGMLGNLVDDRGEGHLDEVPLEIFFLEEVGSERGNIDLPDVVGLTLAGVDSRPDVHLPLQRRADDIQGARVLPHGVAFPVQGIGGACVLESREKKE